VKPGRSCSVLGTASMGHSWPVADASWFGVMEDDSQCRALAWAEAADSVAHGYSIDAAGSADGPLVDGKDDALALAKWDDFDAGLHAGALLGKDELAPGEVSVGLAKEKCNLKGKDELSVEILVEAVVVVLLVSEQERGWTRLAGGMT
jgi:hypothetical protein